MVVAVGVLWLAVGAVAALVMHRRGHDTFSWAILFVLLGPLALPLAVSAERHPPPPPTAPVHPGTLDVLVAHDGSSHAAAGLDAALALLGGRVTSLTLAAVVDAEAVTTVRGRDTVQDAQERLDALASARCRPVSEDIVVGETGEPFELRIELGKVREFARATKSSNPAYLTGERPVVPGTFLTVSRLWETPEAKPWDTPGRNTARVLHGEQEFVFHGELPRATDRLIGQARIADVYEKEGRRGGTMTFTVITTEWRTEDGRLVADSTSTRIETAGPAS